MYITKVIVEGFKSYRDKTVVEFLPGLNVVVGLNGSGKSNLFYAIQFVLSYEFHHLPKAQRESMLHSSAGQRSASAYVEIVFNNEDRRIPDAGNEIRLRRDISSSHDIYTLNNRQILTSQLLSTLQSAGLSKVNPYYIIKQGKINELAMASDAKRLQLFSEIAGSMVWAEKRPEDVKLLDETNRQIEQLHYYLEKTCQSLKDLETQKNEYDEWQTLETRRQALEFLSLRKDRSHLKQRLSTLKGHLNETRSEMKKLASTLHQLKENEGTRKNAFESIRYELQIAQERESHLSQSVQNSMARLCQLEMQIEDKEVHTEKYQQRVESKKAELIQIDAEIQNSQKELETVLSEFEMATSNEYEWNTRLMLTEQNRLQFYAKGARHSQFVSKEERDAWIRTEISKFEAMIKRENAQLSNLASELESTRVDQRRLEEDIRNLQAEKESATCTYVEENNSIKKMEAQLRKLESTRQDLWREENEILQRSRIVTDDVERASKALRKVVSIPIVNGWDSVRTVLQEMRNESETMRRLADGYRGLLVELFSCDEALYTAVDVVAGNRMFYHVVDTDAVATEIVRRMNGHRLPGSVNFFPLNRVMRKRVDYPLLDCAVPMIANLLIHEGMEPVLENVFARTLICNHVSDAFQLAQEHKFDCVTLEGDLVRSSGPLTGGFIAKNRLRIELYANLKKFKSIEAEETTKLNDVRYKLEEVTCQINNVMKDLQQAQTKISRLKFDEIRLTLTLNNENLNVLKQSVESKQTLIRRTEASKKSNEAKIVALEEELDQDMASQLSPSERSELAVIEEEIEKMKENFKNVSQIRENLERRKNELQSRLNNYLLKMRNELKHTIKDLQSAGSTSVVLSQASDAAPSPLTELEEQREALRCELEKNNAELEVVHKRAVELSAGRSVIRKDLDKLRNDRRSSQSMLEKRQDAVNNLIQQISRYEADDSAVTSKVSQFGGISDEMMRQYKDLKGPRIEQELRKVKKRLKQLDVNHKAGMEYTFYQDKHKELEGKCRKMEQDQEECWALLSGIDVQKDDSLQNTFSAVARHFKTIFATLVPSGRAYLKWSYSDDESDQDSDSEDIRPPDMNRITGISIHVSFNGGPKVSQLSSLSGGQRSIVSLALVFAILMLDRAPFYLLDEADMALDKQHRQNVANLISKFAHRSQFIVTTFRPEMLPYADNIVGVTYQDNQTSRAIPITEELADDFICESQSFDRSQSTLQ